MQQANDGDVSETNSSINDRMDKTNNYTMDKPTKQLPNKKKTKGGKKRQTQQQDQLLDDDFTLTKTGKNVSFSANTKQSQA